MKWVEELELELNGEELELNGEELEEPGVRKKERWNLEDKSSIEIRIMIFLETFIGVSERKRMFFFFRLIVGVRENIKTQQVVRAQA